MAYTEEKIKKLYEGKPVIRISVTQSRPRVSVKRGACTIIGVCCIFFVWRKTPAEL